MRLLPVSSFLFAALLACQASALTREDARGMAVGEFEARVKVIQRVVSQPDAQTEALLRALASDSVKFTDQAVIIIDADKGRDAFTGQAVLVTDAAQDVVNNNRMRAEIEAALALIGLRSNDVQERLKSAKALQAEPDENKLVMIERALTAETDVAVRAQLLLATATIQLTASDPGKRLQAAKSLGQSVDVAVKPLLAERLRPDAETDPAVRAALATSLKSIEQGGVWGQRIGAIFSGISLGSILLIAALGLAITYGLMGVINMAHGEFIMIGAYATYLVQVGIKKFLPTAFEGYLLLAVPVAFFSAAAVGAVAERLIIRHLYGRPLETLLATWGLSLVLMQAVRSLFGAQNVPVENPSWLSGGIQLSGGTVLPYNRIAALVFAALVLLAVAQLIARTRLGLFVRGVTQNRAMAASLGLDTAKVDTYAFALGAGIAGLAGCALSQLGNVGPDLGQSYIVDSFMVVVLGGVGQLAGTVIAALGLGVLNKGLEGVAGAVLAKVAVLVFIIVFIQKRPQGLFALKGRSADA